MMVVVLFIGRMTDTTYSVTQNEELFALSADEIPQELPAYAYVTS